MVGRRVQTGVDPFRASPERCPEWRDQHRRGAPDVRCTHAHTRTLGAAPQSRPSRCCQLTRGVAANGRPPRPGSCIATAPPALPGGPSRRPAVPPACTRVPKVTTPRRRPELVKHPVTVRSGRSPQVYRTHRVPAAATLKGPAAKFLGSTNSHRHGSNGTPATLIPREAWQSGRMHLS